jgi:hypothetical protein
MSAVALDFLRRVDLWRRSAHTVRDSYTLECRIREDAAFLIGWGC